MWLIQKQQLILLDAVELLCDGASNRVVALRDGKFVDYDINEALAMKKTISPYEYEVSKMLSR